jgi:hypothetical protein
MGAYLGTTPALAVDVMSVSDGATHVSSLELTIAFVRSDPSAATGTATNVRVNRIADGRHCGPIVHGFFRHISPRDRTH